MERIICCTTSIMFSGLGGVMDIGSGRVPGAPTKTGISGQPWAAVIGGKVGSGVTSGFTVSH